MKKGIFLWVVFLMVFGYQLAFAHLAWIEKKGNKFFVRWGDPPKIDPYDPKRVKKIMAFDSEGKEVSIERMEENDKVYLLPKGDISMITLSFEGGYLVTTPEGKKRMTKKEAQRQGLQIVDSFYNLQFVKSIFKHSNIVTKPTGMKFEIVPLKNPLSLKQSEILPIKVLYEGKPLSGIIIKTGDYKEVGRTDKDGVANIKISEQGTQIVIANHRIPSDDPDADFLLFTAVLTWENK